jgi:hypothetical protein
MTPSFFPPSIITMTSTFIIVTMTLSSIPLIMTSLPLPLPTITYFLSLTVRFLIPLPTTGTLMPTFIPISTVVRFSVPIVICSLCFIRREERRSHGDGHENERDGKKKEHRSREQSKRTEKKEDGVKVAIDYDEQEEGEALLFLSP